MRDGEGTGRKATVHDRAGGEDAGARRGDRIDDLAGGFAGSEDVLDDQDLVAGFDVEAAAEGEGAVLTFGEEKWQLASARATSWPMISPPSAGETTTSSAELAKLRGELFSGRLGAIRPHQEPRALKVRVRVESARRDGSGREAGRPFLRSPSG